MVFSFNGDHISYRSPRSNTAVYKLGLWLVFAPRYEGEERRLISPKQRLVIEPLYKPANLKLVFLSAVKSD